MANNIHPVFHKILDRKHKEKRLNQHAKVIWITGLSGSGKTTIARNIEIELNKQGFLTQVLDGDNIRNNLNSNLGFTEKDRHENIRRIAEVSKLFLDCGIICINSFITPTNKMRKIAFDIIGREDIIEIFTNSPVEVCEQRDTKGLYEKARKGIIKNFTGISAQFELPVKPDVEIRTDLLTIQQAVEKCIKVILTNTTYKNDAQ